jgi:hypothetical protein
VQSFSPGICVRELGRVNATSISRFYETALPHLIDFIWALKATDRADAEVDVDVGSAERVRGHRASELNGDGEKNDNF